MIQWKEHKSWLLLDLNGHLGSATCELHVTR